MTPRGSGLIETVLQRPPRPAMEVADAVAFLVSEHASFITGAELVIAVASACGIG